MSGWRILGCKNGSLRAQGTNERLVNKDLVDVHGLIDDVAAQVRHSLYIRIYVHIYVYIYMFIFNMYVKTRGKNGENAFLLRKPPWPSASATYRQTG